VGVVRVQGFNKGKRVRKHFKTRNERLQKEDINCLDKLELTKVHL